MNLEEIKKIIDLFEAKDLDVLEIQKEGIKIYLSKKDNKSTYNTIDRNSSKQIDDSRFIDITTPLVGIIRFEQNIEVGLGVKKGDKLFSIEAMKMISDIVAPFEGRIENIFVKNKDLVQFEQKIIRISKYD